MKKLMVTFLSFILACSWVTVASAGQEVRFLPDNSNIEASIKYSVVGKYKAVLDQYEGIITLDEKGELLKSASLSIEVKSLRSRFPRLDKIVRSDRLLDVEKYPDITFKSQAITQSTEGYKVIGVLGFHGITKEMVFLFDSTITKEKESGKKILTAQGKWIIQRKDFGIVWSKAFDKGGIIVGNHITVKWVIEVEVK